MNLPPLYLLSSDFSHDITPITCHLYNKYLPGLNINILSYTKPDFELPSNVNFIELNNGNKRIKIIGLWIIILFKIYLNMNILCSLLMITLLLIMLTKTH